MNPSLTQIIEYLQHDDLDLANRRILDAVAETGDSKLIDTAIHCSAILHDDDYAESEKITRYTKEIGVLIEALKMKPVLALTPKALAIVKEIEKQYTASSFKLHPISFKIHTGEIIGVVGENGNGKTTLLGCLSGMLSITGGSIIYKDIPQSGYYAVKHKVAFIPQRIPEWYGMLKDNLHFSASIAGVYDAENNRNVNFMMERLGLTKYAHLTWSQISSGYRTRFEIARVLLQKPHLLILDEPLANLDIKAQQTLLMDLKFMTKSQNQPMGVVLSSQQLHEVEKVADTMFLIKNGKCIHQSDTSTDGNDAVLEIETNVSREVLLQALQDNATIQFNGGIFTLSSTVLSAKEMLMVLMQNNIEINYSRDITHSTKRYF